MTSPTELVYQELRSCCRDTVEKHAPHNPMIGCSGCNHLIKNFSDERAFLNYVHFCNSQNREIQIGKVKNLFIAIYQPFKTNMPTKLSLLTRSEPSEANA